MFKPSLMFEIVSFCLFLIELLVLLLLAESGRCRVVQNVISMGILALLSILVIVISLQLGARCSLVI